MAKAIQSSLTVGMVVATIVCFIVIYLFVVWLLLIIGTAALNRGLPPDSANPANGAEGE